MAAAATSMPASQPARPWLYVGSTPAAAASLASVACHLPSVSPQAAVQPEVEAWTAVMLEWPAGVKDQDETPYTVEFPDTRGGAGENEGGGKEAAT